MDVCYYNNQIKEELDGACDYIQRAIITKAEHPQWSALYMRMSDAELEHAKDLIDIFEDDYKESATDDPIYEDIRAALLSMYTENVAKIRLMHQSYASK